jgi:tol-pal system protein YbgF
MLIVAGLLLPPGTVWAQSSNMQLPRPLLPGFGQKRQAAQVQQSTDEAVRVIQMEDQLRQLTGRIEELNFQILELQEKMRKMQEDNEFRFQDLESRRGGVEHGSGSSKIARQVQPPEVTQRGKLQPSEPVNSAPGTGGDSIAHVIENGQPVRSVDGVELYDGQSRRDGGTGPQPQALGSMTFDANGNIVDTNIDKPIDLTRRSRGGQPLDGVPADGGNREIAALPSSGDPEQLYELGYNYIQAGDYELAENTFGEFAARYPDHPQIAEARFWLGESLYSQGQYEEAARIFLDAHKQYPNSRMGAQTLLKLANSLAAMNQRELACATYAEVPKKYPDISKPVRDKLAADRISSSCNTN